MKSYADIKGDGGSRVAEQIGVIRKTIRNRLAPIRYIIGVGSGKGGVGKSTLVMQLALALRARALEVGILDVDFNAPSIATMSGVRDALFIPSEQGVHLPKTVDGIRVFSSGSILSETESLAFDSRHSGESYTWRQTKEFTVLSDLLARCEWGALDVLLVDLPPGPERTEQFASFFGPSMQMLLVSIPSDISLAAVSRGLSALEESAANVLGYVENMRGYLCPETGALRPLFPEQSKTSLLTTCLGEVPFEPMLASLCDNGLTQEAWESLDCASYVRAIVDRVLCTLEDRDEISLRAM